MQELTDIVYLHFTNYMMTNFMLFPPQPQINGLLKVMSLLTLHIEIIDFYLKKKINSV